MINDFNKSKIDDILNKLPPANDIPEEDKATINIQNSIFKNQIIQTNVVNSSLFLLLIVLLCGFAFIFF